MTTRLAKSSLGAVRCTGADLERAALIGARVDCDVVRAAREEEFGVSQLVDGRGPVTGSTVDGVDVRVQVRAAAARQLCLQVKVDVAVDEGDERVPDRARVLRPAPAWCCGSPVSSVAETVVPNTESPTLIGWALAKSSFGWWSGRGADVDGDRAGAVHAGVVGHVVVEGVSAMERGIRRIEEGAGAVDVLERAVRGKRLGARERDRVPIGIAVVAQHVEVRRRVVRRRDVVGSAIGGEFGPFHDSVNAPAAVYPKLLSWLPVPPARTPPRDTRKSRHLQTGGAASPPDGFAMPSPPTASGVDGSVASNTATPTLVKGSLSSNTAPVWCGIAVKSIGPSPPCQRYQTAVCTSGSGAVAPPATVAARVVPSVLPIRPLSASALATWCWSAAR